MMPDSKAVTSSTQTKGTHVQFNRRTNLRFYSFTNFYLNTISQGIQPAHVIGRAAHYYRKKATEASETFWAWLDEESGTNETMICLNGGMAGDVADAYQQFEPLLSSLGIPSMIFYEEPRALGARAGLARGTFPTSWGVVLPEELHSAEFIRYPAGDQAPARYSFNNETIALGPQGDQPADMLFDFLQYKNRCGLAR